MNDYAITSLLKIIIFLPFVLVLAWLCLKIGGSKLTNISGKRILKTIEKMPLSNKAALHVVLIDEKPYLISSSDQSIEILMELPLDCIERTKNENYKIDQNLIRNIIAKIVRKEKL